MARSRTRATKSLTTRKLTSASSRARRMSRRAASRSASVIRALPRRRSVTPCRRADRDSNIDEPMREWGRREAPASGCPFYGSPDGPATELIGEEPLHERLGVEGGERVDLLADAREQDRNT